MEGRPMFRFTIRELVLVTVVVGLGAGLFSEKQRHHAALIRLTWQRIQFETELQYNGIYSSCKGDEITIENSLTGEHFRMLRGGGFVDLTGTPRTLSP